MRRWEWALAAGAAVACSDDSGDGFRAFGFELSSPLPAAELGAPYDAEIEGVGGEAPLRWRVASGADELAPGLRLRGDGRVVGTPTEAGRHRVTARVEDATFAFAFVDLDLVVFDPRDPSTGDGTCLAPLRLQPAEALRVTGRLPETADGDDGCDLDEIASRHFELVLDTPALVTWSVESTAEVYVTGVTDCDDLEIEACTRRRLEVADVGPTPIRVFGEPGASFRLDVEVVGGTEDGTCASPVRIELPRDGDDVTLGGSFRGPDREATSCGRTGGPEVVARLELDAPADLEVAGVAGGFNLALREATCSSGVEVGCFGFRAFEDSAFRALRPGTYFLLLEAEDPFERSAYGVRIVRRPPSSRPPNDRCEAALSLDPPPEGASLSYDFLGARPDDRFRDLKLYWTLETTDRRRIEVASNPGVELALRRADACDDRESFYSRGPELCSPVLEPGRWVLEAIGNRNEAGDLFVQSEPAAPQPPNARCDFAEVLDPSSGAVELELPLSDTLVEPESTECFGAFDATPRLWYRFSLDARSDVSVGQRAGDVTFALLSGGCEPTGFFDCFFEDATFYGLEPGPYWLAVRRDRDDADCRDPDEPRYRVSIEASPSPPPPPNDRCSGARPIVFTDGLGRLQGTTRGATLENEPPACFQAGVGPDVYHRLTLDAPATVRFVRLSSDFAVPSLSLQTASSCGGAEFVACTSANLASPVFEDVPAGDYVIRVAQSSAPPQGPPIDYDFAVELAR